MQIVAFLSCFLLSASLSLNAYFYFKLKKIKNTPTYDARELIHDLTRGGALVRVTRIDPDHLMLRSPRGTL